MSRMSRTLYTAVSTVVSRMSRTLYTLSTVVSRVSTVVSRVSTVVSRMSTIVSKVSTNVSGVSRTLHSVHNSDSSGGVVVSARVAGPGDSSGSAQVDTGTAAAESESGGREERSPATGWPGEHQCCDHWALGLATGCQETRTCDSDSDSNGDGAPVHPLSECWARLPGLGSGLPLNRHSELWLHCMMIWWWRGGGGLVEERDWYFYPLQTDVSIKWQMWNVFFFLSATLFIPRC